MENKRRKTVQAPSRERQLRDQRQAQQTSAPKKRVKSPPKKHSK